MIETEQQPQPYSVRLPALMRKQLEDYARECGRSLHAEILLRLSNSLERPKNDSVETPTELKTMMRDIALEVVKEELAKAGLQLDRTHHP